MYVEPASTRMVASMGPPLKAAENSRDLESFARLLDARFNGAAAKSSGKYGSYLPNGRVERASMGPPLKAAENRDARRRAARRHGGFNGAAAKSSGKYLERKLKNTGALQLQWGRR